MSDDLLYQIIDKLAQLDSKVTQLDDKFNQLDGKVTQLDKRVEDGFSEVTQELKVVNFKLDYIKEQVATNTEMQYGMKQIEDKLNEHDTDIKLIKKIITNQ